MDKLNTATDNLRANPYEIHEAQQEEDDIAVVKAVWKSAHAVEDWPGKVTIRRFSPFKKFVVEGEGCTHAEAWRNVANRIRKMWRESE